MPENPDKAPLLAVISPSGTPSPVATSPDSDLDRRTLSLRFSKEFHAALDHLAEKTQLNKTQLLELSVALFYRNFFEKEFAQIPDIALFLDELATLTTEHTEEVANLAQIGVTLIDVEAELPTDVEKS
jgi:predicted transcriptional regulator